jgi:flagellar motility protein MotE (MotC chaperone)
VILALLAMFFGYNLTLDGRTTKLERKNGKELKEIAELKERVKELETKNQDQENRRKF